MYIVDALANSIRFYEDTRIMLSMLPPEAIDQYFKDILHSQSAGYTIIDRLNFIKSIVEDTCPQYIDKVNKLLVLI
jgi:hypothetical protein